MLRARHAMTITATKAHCRLAFSSCLYSRAAWQHRYYITKVCLWRKDVVKEGHAPFYFNFFSAKDVWTINLTDSFYLYLYLNPHEKCFFSDGGLRDRDIIFRDETDLVFCFLGCVVTFSAREANSWRRRATSNPGNWVCVFFSFFPLPNVLAFFFCFFCLTIKRTRGKAERRQRVASISELQINVRLGAFVWSQIWSDSSTVLINNS